MSEQSKPIPEIAKAPPRPPVDEGWFRVGALIVDVVILGIIGHLLGLLFWRTWFEIGPYGRLVGLPVVLLYFGLLNSRLTQGQTPGKRLFRVAVRQADGQPVGLGRSFLRMGVLAVPALFAGWALPLFQAGLGQWLQTVFVGGMGGLIVYSFFAHQESRQSLHDLIARTYVIFLPGRPVRTYPTSPPLSGIAVSAVLGIAVIFASLLSYGDHQRQMVLQTPATRQLARTLQAENHFFTVAVTGRTVNRPDQTLRLLDVVVWTRGYLETEEKRTAMIDQIAQIALTTMEEIETFDLLNVSVRMAFDIGLARRDIRFGVFQPIEDWQTYFRDRSN